MSMEAGTPVVLVMRFPVRSGCRVLANARVGRTGTPLAFAGDLIGQASADEVTDAHADGLEEGDLGIALAKGS